MNTQHSTRASLHLVVEGETDWKAEYNRERERAMELRYAVAFWRPIACLFAVLTIVVAVTAFAGWAR